jgi:hypothetical protein
MYRLDTSDRPGVMIRRTALFLAMVGLVAGCSTSGGQESTTIPLVDRDISQAQNCEEVADILTAHAQQGLDAVGTRGVDEDPPDAGGTGGVDLFELAGEAFERAETLPDCDSEALEILFCERNPSLESHGPAGDEFKEFWFAPSHCDSDSAPTFSTTSVAETESPSATSEPPWELDAIDHPDTAEEVMTTLDAMPAEIEGVQAEMRDGQAVIYGDDDSSFGINVLPLSDIRDFSGDPDATTTDFLSVLVDSGELEAVEYQDIDDEGIAVLAATSRGNGILRYTASWTDPGGEWLFSLTANTPETRTQLVQAYIAAAGASTD